MHGGGPAVESGVARAVTASGRHAHESPFRLTARGARTILIAMRKLLIFLGVLLAAHVALLFVRPGGAQPVTAASGTRPLTVGIVFDVGGRGDKSFNDGAYLGAMRAARELGADVR